MTIELAILLITIVVVAMKFEVARVPPWVDRLDAHVDHHVNCRCELHVRTAMCRGGPADGYEFVDTGSARHKVQLPKIDPDAPWQFVPALGYRPVFGRIDCIYWRADIAGCEPLTHRNGQRLYYHESMVKEGTCLDD